MGRLAVLALLVTAVSGFVPGARPLRTAPRAASRSTRTVRMAMVRIVFTIKPNGVVQEEVQGLKGPACYQLTDSLNKALGGTVFETTPTEEYYMEPEEVRVFFALRSRRPLPPRRHPPPYPRDSPAQNILADSVLGRLMGLSEDLTVEQQKVFTKDGGGGSFETW